MTTEAQSAPAWARGHEVAYLKRVTALFAAHDQGHIYSPHGRYSEVSAAADLATGHLSYSLEQGWAMVSWQPARHIPVTDFTRQRRAVVPPGADYVRRMAWTGEEGRAAVHRVLRGTTRPWVWAWQEHRQERALLESLGLTAAAVKVTAASEMRGLYTRSLENPSVLDPADLAGITQLPVDLPAGAAEALLTQTLGLAYASHYSGYNKSDTWRALALRGYDATDPAAIEKPAEMSTRWKEAHSGWEGQVCGDTPLRAALPAVEPLLAALPVVEYQRVRLMWLAPGGGELTRHADITDPEAGATPGRVARLHVPLVTNDRCAFTSWSLNGVPRKAHMPVGSVCYLDTRKPHTAVNAGDTPRLHLVADAVVSPALYRMLVAAGGAA